VRRSDVAALYGLTKMEVVEGEDCPDQPGMAKFDRVVIETPGSMLDSGPIRHPRGHANAPMSDDELAAKFRDCARNGQVPDSANLLARLQGLDTMANVGELAT